MSNQLTQIARDILAIEADLIHRLNYSAKEKPTVDDFAMYTFEQTWGSTSLGFGGIGGQAMTTARTYVFVPNIADQKCFVYFAGRFAYAVPYSQALVEDIRDGKMASVSSIGRYTNRG